MRDDMPAGGRGAETKDQQELVDFAERATRYLRSLANAGINVPMDVLSAADRAGTVLAKRIRTHDPA